MEISAASELVNNRKSYRNNPRSVSHCCSIKSSKFYILIPLIFLLLILYQNESLQNISPSLSMFSGCREDLLEVTKLRDSVTFLPLKDLRYAKEPMKDQTWFMSSLKDLHEEGEPLYQQFPNEASKGRILCLKGNDTQDGSWNSYALAWPNALPPNAKFKKGITFVSYNYYDYHNLWHGLSATMGFVRWYAKNQCSMPNNWILYHWGELRSSMSPWLNSLLQTTFSTPIYIENLDVPLCFEKAVVMRHNEAGISKENRMETYDLMRCKARMYCNVSSETRLEKGFKIGMTLLMREGSRSFKNSSAVIDVFEKECRKVKGCRLKVAYPHNLTFCEQVEVMSATDIVISTHGAQLSNIIFMDRNSSIMELFPKGWLELAGVGQFVFHWLAEWSGMKHQGTWRDPVGDQCPFPEHDTRCFSRIKDGKVGHNETYFSEWAISVLDYQMKMRKAEEEVKTSSPVSGVCGCI